MTDAGQTYFFDQSLSTEFFPAFRKGAGSNSATVSSVTLPGQRVSAIQTTAPGANSAKSCRHAPHGLGPPLVRATTATATRLLCPSVNALNRATRSAQQVSP